MLLTYSSLAAFKNCRRRYHFRYVEGLEQKERPVYFDFGTAIHLGLAGHYKGVSNGIVLDEVDRHFLESAWDEEDQERLAKWMDARRLAASMLRGYFERYKVEPFKVLDVEREFVLPIIDVRGEAFESIKLAGKVDAIVEEGGGLWVMEHKTASKIDENYLAGLTLDQQSMIYLEAMERVYGKSFRGVIYNVLLKAAPEKPMLLKNGKLSQSKQQSTTVELYLAAIEEHGLDRADYTEMLEYLTCTRRDYFYREYLTFSQEERGEWRRELWQIAADIERATRLGAFYRNTGQCVGYTRCAFYKICVAPDQDFVIENSFVRKPIHSELEGNHE
jgi:hypothetical protein